METTEIRRQIAYEGFNQERWLMTIGFDNVINVVCNAESRSYEIPERIIKIEHDTEYVYLYVEGNMFYQFKFEFEKFLVGDVFTNDGEFLNSFAQHVFGE